jgi:TonB family protein
MSREPRNGSEQIFPDCLGSLGGCLVEGSPEQRRSERRGRRRALVLSVLLESAAVTLLVLVPLFGKTERIAVTVYVPIPPYGHANTRPRGNRRPAPSRPTAADRFTFQRPTNRPAINTAGAQNPADGTDFLLAGGNSTDEPNCAWCVPVGDKTTSPPPPVTETQAIPKIVRITKIDPAMLVHRVEPVYPELAKQVHREGRVELRAIIGTDGSIQSLQIVAGDPLFQLSAREAVQQWRYRPTILNGQAVEIDTYITVIYTLGHE